MFLNLQEKLVTIFIPIFLMFLILEVIYSQLKSKNLYRFTDTLSNLSCGIMDRIINVFIKAFIFALYILVYNNTPFDMLSNQSIYLQFLIGFILYDFMYYWFHRYSHEYNILWANHIVHHNSEEYNFSVALRQGPFQKCLSIFFYLPVAAIGVSPKVFITIGALNLIYQFFLHTQVIKKLPKVFEYVFNTPSHHRIHHAKDKIYWDKNYGATLIIWDRIFSTFKEESIPPNYGVSIPIQTHSAFWGVFYWWGFLLKRMIKQRSLSSLKLLFKSPSFTFNGEEDWERSTSRKLIYTYPKQKKRVSILLFIIILLLFALLIIFPNTSMVQKILNASAILVVFKVLFSLFLKEEKRGQ